MDKYKTIVTLPAGYSELFGSPNKVSDSASAYSLVPLIYRAVQIRADSLSSVDFNLYDENGDIEPWPFTVSPASLIHQLEAGLLLTGAGYIEPARNTGKYVRDLTWVNPTSIQMKFEGGSFTFTQNGNDRGTWVNIPSANQYEMIYFREFNISDDTRPGPGAAQVALMSAGLLRYTADFASKFFEHGAMPVGLLSIEQNITDAERVRIENFFRRMVQGIANAWKILAVRGPAKIDYLTPPIKDMTMPELRAEARHDIALAFGIPQTLLENSANFATAVQHDATFWETTIRPRGNWIAQTFNEQLFNLVKINDKRLHAEFAFDEMDVFQEDESVRAGSLLNLVAAGFDLITAADVLGYDLTDEQLARLESLNNTEPAQTLADVQKAKWMRKALKSLEKGKGAGVSFESEDIPSDEHVRIAGLLSIAKTPVEVRSAFTRRDSQGAIDRLNETLREALERLN